MVVTSGLRILGLLLATSAVAASLGPPAPVVVKLSPEEWSALLQKLGSDSFAEREAGQKQLKLVPLENLVSLRDLAKKETDPEVKARLDSRLTEMNSEFKALVEQAAASDRQGNMARTLALFNRAVSVDPEDRSLLQRRGDLLQDAGKHADAVADYTRVIELTGGREAQLFICRGVARADGGDLAGGIADLSEAIRLAPFSALAYFNRSLVYEDQGNLDAAIADASKAIELDANYTDAYYDRGTFKHNKGDQVGAIADFDQAIRLRPDYAYAYCNRAFAKQVSGDAAGALLDFGKALALNPKQPWAYSDRGTIYLDQSRWKEALQDFEEHIALDPHNPEGYLLAWIARSRLGDSAGAVEDLKKFLAREADEKTFAAKRRIVALLVGKISEELLLKEAEAAGTGSNSAACFYAGVLRANAGDKKGAETLLDKAEKLAPMNSLVRLNAAGELRRLRDTR